MRMWMVPPRYLCNKHLLGEHVELHMFAGYINKWISLDGYVANGLVDTSLMNRRHDELVEEIRGFCHEHIRSSGICASSRGTSL